MSPRFSVGGYQAGIIGRTGSITFYACGCSAEADAHGTIYIAFCIGHTKPTTTAHRFIPPPPRPRRPPASGREE